MTATTTLEATGTGSTLTLANLASVTEGANSYLAQTQFEALAGGTVTLSALQTINTGTVVLESDGTGSVLNVAALTSFAEANGWTYSTLQASNGGTVNDSSLASLSNVNLTIAAAATINLGGLTSPVATIDLTVTGTGEHLTLCWSDVVQQRQHHGQRRGDLSLPGVTSYTGNGCHDHAGGDRHRQHADPGQPGERDQGANSYLAQTQFEALAGGTVTLSALQTINTGTVILESDGTGSVLNVAALTSFTEANGWTLLDIASLQRRHGRRRQLASLSNVNC